MTMMYRALVKTLLHNKQKKNDETEEDRDAVEQFPRVREQPTTVGTAFVGIRQRQH